MAAKSKSKKKNKSKNGNNKKSTPAVTPDSAASPIEQTTPIEPTSTSPDSTMSVTTPTPDSVKELQDMDPMKRIPLELAVKVFIHLNIPDIIKCRRVCKAWRGKIIDSKEIKFMMVKRWETHSPSDAARKPCSSSATDAERAKDIEERYQLLQSQFCGHPISQHLLKRPKPPIKGHSTWSLKGRYLAHLGPLDSVDAAHYVYLHDLVTGSAKKITPSEYMYIGHVLLTETLLAYWGGCQFCVMPLDSPGSEARIIQLPGVSLPSPGHGHRQYIAFFGAKNRESKPRVWLYDYDKDSLKIFDSTETTDSLGKTECCFSMGLAIDSHYATGQIYCVVFSAVLKGIRGKLKVEEQNSIELHIEYLTLDGVSLKRTALQFMSRVSKFNEHNCWWITVRSVGAENVYHLRTGFTHHGVTNDLVVDLRGPPRITSTLQHAPASVLWKDIWYQSDYYMDYAIKNSRRNLKGTDSWKYCSSIRRNEVAMHGHLHDMCINDSFLVMMVDHHGETLMHVLYFDQSLAPAAAMLGKIGIVPTVQRTRAQLTRQPRVSDHAFVWRPGNWELVPKRKVNAAENWRNARLGPDAAANCKDCVAHLGLDSIADDFRAFAMGHGMS